MTQAIQDQFTGLYSPQRRFALRHPEKYNATRRNWSHKRRLEIISKLGNKCIICGFDDPRALCIDHINGGGREELRNISNTSTRYYRMVEEHPERYQLLCHNHNWIKKCENHEGVKVWD
jgi:hypothetical protein